MMMKRTTTTDPEIRALTTAEIARKQGMLSARYQEIVSERAENYRSAQTSGPAPVFDADERAEVENARHLLNGAATESLSLPTEVTRDRIQLREHIVNNIEMKILSSIDFAALTLVAV